MNRLLDLSDQGAYLRVQHGQLVVERHNMAEVRIPLNELGALVVGHAQVGLTQPVLREVCLHGGALVVCDEKRMPCGMLLPLGGHGIQTERMALQAHAPLPLRKHLWRQLVRAKIRAQAALLKTIDRNDAVLETMATRVRSGDPENLEAQAARRYWPKLFGKNFRRRRDEEDANRLLNFGYAILRATVGRAVCASGLHPSIGVHHHNRYDVFCLASDLMEPFRPLVDRAVHTLVQEHGHEVELTPAMKKTLITSMTLRLEVKGEQRDLFDACGRTAASLAQAFEGKHKTLVLPNPAQVGGG